MADAKSRATFVLDAETKQYISELSKADKAQKEFAKNADRDLSAAFTKVGTAAAAAAAALGAIVVNAVDRADQVTQEANLLGISADKLIAYKFAAEDAGAGAEVFTKALKEGQRLLAENGTEVQVWTQRLGLSVQDLRRQDPAELFSTYADAISKLNTRGEQFAATQALMGGKAAALTGLLSQGSEALREAEETTRRYGAALNGIEIEQLQQVDASFDKLTLGAQGAANVLALSFGPAIEDIVTRFVDATAGSQAFKDGARDAAEVAYVGFKLLAGGLDTVQAGLQGLAGAVTFTYALVEQLVGNGAGAARLKATAQSFFDDAAANLANVKSITELRADFERLALDSEKRAREAAELRAQEREAGRAAANGSSIAGGESFELGKLGKIPKIELDQAEIDRTRIIEEGKAAVRNEAFRAEAEQQQRRIGLYAEADRTILEQLFGRHQAEIELEEIKNQSLSGSLGGFLSAFSAHSKQVAKVAQGLAAAQVIYATGKNIAAAFPNFGLMAQAALVGATQLATIRSTSPSSGGGGFGGGGFGGSPSGVSNLADSRQEQSASAALGAQQRPQLTIAFNGPVAGERAFIDLIRKQIDRDVTVIYGSSRQNSDLQPT